MNKRLATYLLAGATLLLLSTGCVNLPERPLNGTWSNKETPADFLIYENKDKGFNVKYPPQWQLKEDSEAGGILFLSPIDDETDTFMENVDVVYNPQRIAVPIDLLYDAEIADIKKTYPDTQIITSEKIMFKGMPAYHITALITSEGATYKDQMLIVLNGSREYLIAYMATEEDYEQHKETAEQIMGSFQMT